MFCSDLNGGVTREWRDVTPASPLLATPQSSPAHSSLSCYDKCDE